MSDINTNPETYDQGPSVFRCVIQTRRPILGCVKVNGVLTLPKDKAGRWQMSLKHWRASLRQAAGACSLPAFVVESLHLPDSITVPEMGLYRRYDGKPDNPDRKTYSHESIPKDCRLTFDVICDALPDVDWDISLRRLLTVLGDYYGISPWGSQFGYGRFHVLSVSLTNKVESNLPTLQLDSAFVREWHNKGRNYVRARGKSTIKMSEDDLFALVGFLQHSLESRATKTND